MTPDITTYIPQRHPFVMVDTVLRADEHIAETNFTIKSDNIFVQNGFFTEPGLVENMAQTGAAGVGYRASLLGIPPSVGYIGALKNLSIIRLPKINDTLRSEITWEHRIMQAHVVAGKIFVNDQLIASCEMKIFVKE